MKRGFTLTMTLAWFAVVAGCFAFYQFGGLERANPFGDYAASAIKVLAIAAVASALGLRLVGSAKPGLGDLVVGLAVGLAGAGIAALALAALGLLRPYVIWPLVVVTGVLTRGGLRAIASALRRSAPAGLEPMEAVLAGLVGCAALVALAGSLAPLTANDALVYHLNIPKIYSAASGLVKLPLSAYANMPHYGETVYALFYSVAGETGARMAYLVMLAGATLAVFALARRLAPRWLAAGAAAIFLVQPLVLDGRVVCNVDVLLAYIYIAAVILLLDAPRSGTQTRRMLVAGGLAGFMLGIKYSALAPCLSLVAVPLAAWPARPGARHLLVGAAVALTVFAPWLIKNQAYVGNPFYPVFERTFDGANWDASQEDALVGWQRSMGMGRGVSDYLALPLNASTRGKPAMNYAFFDGTMTPLVLALFPLALIRRSRRTLTLAGMAAALFIFWAATSQQLRFLLPAIALGAALGAAGLANLAAAAGARSARIVLGFAAAAAGLALIVPDQYGRPFAPAALAERLPVVLGLETRQQYLERNLQSYALFDHIGKTLPPGEPVFLVWENRGYYLPNPYFADSFFEASTAMRLVAASSDADQLARSIGAMGYRYVVVNDLLGEVFSRYYPPAEVAKLKAFIADHLEAVKTANKMTLYALRP